MFFENNGFKTGDVYLPGLDITIRLDPNSYFRDEGITDVDAQTDKILHKLNTSLKNKIDIQINSGGHIGITSGDKKASLIFVRKSNPTRQLFYRGHESTHALIFLGYEQILNEILRSEGFNLNPFQRYSDEESITNIGGIFGIYKAKKLKKIKNYPSSNPSYLVPLINDLMNSKESYPTRIRKATKEDLPICSRLIQRVFDEVIAKYFPSNPKIIEIWKNYMSLPNLRKEIEKADFIVYEEKNSIIGVGALEEAEIKKVYVLPEFQRKGIGKSLVQRLEQMAKEKGITVCELYSTPNTTEFYKKLNYKEEGSKIMEQGGLCVTFPRMIKHI